MQNSKHDNGDMIDLPVIAYEIETILRETRPDKWQLLKEGNELYHYLLKASRKSSEIIMNKMLQYSGEHGTASMIHQMETIRMEGLKELINEDNID